MAEARRGEAMPGARVQHGWRHPHLTASRTLIALEVFLAAGALPGGVVLALHPSDGGAMGFSGADLEGTPFANFLIPGLFLFGAMGIGALAAVIAHVRRWPGAPYLSATVGLLAVVFECIELMIIPFSPLQPLYLVVGLAVFGLATRVPADARALSNAAAGLSRPRVSYAVAAVALVALFAVYGFAIRPWFMNLGATDAERQAAFPGDELRPTATWQTTRAVTIDAPADAVWAWLIQHGQDRAGFYSYDWLENLTGADIHNADQIRPEWQQRGIGGGIPMSRPILGGRSDATVLTVDIADPGRALVTTDADGNVSARVLVPVDENTTRLVFRDRFGGGDAGTGASISHWLIWDPMHFVMQQRMLLGVKARAEGTLGEPRALHAVASAGWPLAGLAVLGVFALRRRYWPWLAFPIAVTLPALLLAQDPRAALAGFLAAGITTLGAVRWGRRWWPPFSLLAAFVLLVLLLTADAYAAFGLLFEGVLLAGGGVWLLNRYGARLAAAREGGGA